MKFKFKILVILSLMMLIVLYVINLESVKIFFHTISNASLDELTSIIRAWGIWGPILSIIFMIIQSFTAFVPSFILTGANGIIYGLFWGSVISWSAAMIGATITFSMTRLIGESFINHRIKDSKFKKYVDEISQKQGFKVVLIARLLPIVSFVMISYASGLSTIRFRKYILATGVGMIPGTIAYVYFGSQIIEFTRYSQIFSYLFLSFIAVYIGLSIVRKYKKNKLDNTLIIKEKGDLL
ncbi:MAG: TVP38/TMEM64 family protein [Acholeplasmataceae bacterium]|nr:TVP38/TMEM64 family protein [Acholeplasmataceae bacterium]